VGGSEGEIFRLAVANMDRGILDLFRSAFIGLCASCVSDTASNSLRVLKTAKQTAAGTGIQNSYTEIAKKIIVEDGLSGLFGRGLQVLSIFRYLTICLKIIKD
jgi:hypothetical protein